MLPPGRFLDSLTKTVLAAHTHTCLYTVEQRQQLKMTSLDEGSLLKYKHMVRLVQKWKLYTVKKTFCTVRVTLYELRLLL